ncbi:hypothetical protein COU00_03855 [Candidatus Falkowbacteria bacterium CG10_big_fil_rev_8_21_14_0_10_43_11]|uniref:ABC transporter ATP-binding protein n=1 Tax=Candidatus Falkowbacteria bacterium CG10_big_fil_rev_8_21_14_0_10_43_11 TaxID=1974568 RepID=A0A2M6WLE0_9BACT|nr:MAG: hypothetical protein COU00_03855 [Candidatus Falkowbacteria bacterium CG10_big_fil_rev_8_21_14_0_10_43_11]
MAILVKDNKIRTVIKLSRRAFGKYKLQTIILTALGFLTGLLEGVGISAIIPLFSFITKDKENGTDFISQSIENFFLYFNINFSVNYLLIFVSLLFVARAVLLILCGFIKIKITTDYQRCVRDDLFNKTIKSNWPHLLKQKVGYLDTVIINDVNNGAKLLDQISMMIMTITSLLMYTLVAVNISFYITGLTFVLGGILFLVCKPLIYKTRVLARETGLVNKDVAHYIGENIIGMKTIKTMSVENRVIATGKKHFDKLKELEIKLYLLKEITGDFIPPVSLVFICVIFAFSYQSPAFNFAALAAIIYLIQKIFSYIQQLQNTLHSVSASAPFLITVMDYQEQSEKNKEAKGGANSFEFNDKLEFSNVSFSYNGSSKILSRINFAVKKGELVGLIGPSGAGKTTIVDLILRLFQPSGGEILLDGKNINSINLEEWRKNAGYVSQDMFLINDTIANNIRFYNPEISDKAIAEAAKMANIYDFIQSCPEKFATVVGERGVLLSAGQRQRIAIARVLVRQPKFLVLDEATSALDNESELEIQEVIKGLREKVTVFIVAHRLSTVINSDRLIVLADKRIIEQGSPDSLLQNKQSYFAKVYNL